MRCVVKLSEMDDVNTSTFKDFNEARRVFSVSARSSAALLRLVVQKLCRHLGYPGRNINTDIGSMVADGKLSPLVQQALDSVRVIGNEAVHPGQIDFDDNPEVALQLFTLINFIVSKMITEPRQIQEIYNNLPSEVLQGIERRDESSTTTP